MAATAQQVDLAQGGRQNFPFSKCSLKYDANLCLVTGANAGGTITVNADTGGRGFVLNQVFGGYNGATGTGSITITDGATTITLFSKATGGSDEWDFDPPRSFLPNTAITAVIGPGGAGVIGQLQLNGHFEL
jgi:hypothetical protein